MTETSILTDLEKAELVYRAELKKHPLYEVYSKYLIELRKEQEKEAILLEKEELRKKYPKYKVVTIDFLETFCKKNNLVYKGSISDYERDIPLESLKLIAEFNSEPAYMRKEFLYISAPESHFLIKEESDEDPLVYFFPKNHSKFAIIVTYWNTDDDLSCL